MLLIVCEDKTAGKKFWDTINTVFFDERAKVKSAEGVKNMLTTLQGMAPKRGDHVLFALDSVSSKYVDTLLRRLRVFSVNRGFSYTVTRYWCWEEAIMSFQNFAEWAALVGDYVKDWEGIREFVLGKSEHNYFRDPYYRRKYGMTQRTRERFAKAVLADISGKSRGTFTIRDDTFGCCWSSDCVPVPHEYGLDYCERCVKTCVLYESREYHTAQVKLKYLWDRSNLRRLVCPLSVLQSKL